MVRNEGSNLNFWWPLTSIINVSYNLKVRPCSNTSDTRLPSYRFSLFVFVRHGSSFCLSKHAGACAAALNNLPTSTPPRSPEGGRGPALHSSDQRATCLTSSKPLHREDGERIPNLAWVMLCISGALHACNKLSRVSPEDEHGRHMWITCWWGRHWKTWMITNHGICPL